MKFVCITVLQFDQQNKQNAQNFTIKEELGTRLTIPHSKEMKINNVRQGFWNRALNNFPNVSRNTLHQLAFFWAVCFTGN